MQLLLVTLVLLTLAVVLWRSRRLSHYRQLAVRQARIGAIAGEPVVPTPLHDQSSLPILCSDKPGDHIGWHVDHNFYRGRHFSVLLPVENRGRADGGLSHATLMVKDVAFFGRRALWT